MIARLTGKLVDSSLEEVIVDVGGVGYQVFVPVGTPGRAKRDEAGHVTLSIYTAVREDAIQLYGFADEQEKRVYTKLISVSGIGPRIGLSVLSALSVAEVVAAVRDDDLKAFTQVSGVGKKTGQRLLLELKNAFDDLQDLAAAPNIVPAGGGAFDDLRSALVNLGYKAPIVEDVISQLDPEGDASLEHLIRRALQMLRSNDGA